jgi:hypothetical protein
VTVITIALFLPKLKEARRAYDPQTMQSTLTVLRPGQGPVGSRVAAWRPPGGTLIGNNGAAAGGGTSPNNPMYGHRAGSFIGSAGGGGGGYKGTYNNPRDRMQGSRITPPANGATLMAPSGSPPNNSMLGSPGGVMTAGRLMQPSGYALNGPHNSGKRSSGSDSPTPYNSNKPPTPPLSTNGNYNAVNGDSPSAMAMNVNNNGTSPNGNNMNGGNPRSWNRPEGYGNGMGPRSVELTSVTSDIGGVSNIGITPRILAPGGASLPSAMLRHRTSVEGNVAPPTSVLTTLTAPRLQSRNSRDERTILTSSIPTNNGNGNNAAVNGSTRPALLSPLSTSITSSPMTMNGSINISMLGGGGGSVGAGMMLPPLSPTSASEAPISPPLSYGPRTGARSSVYSNNTSIITTTSHHQAGTATPSIIAPSMTSAAIGIDIECITTPTAASPAATTTAAAAEAAATMLSENNSNNNSVNHGTASTTMVNDVHVMGSLHTTISLTSAVSPNGPPLAPPSLWPTSGSQHSDA